MSIIYNPLLTPRDWDTEVSAGTIPGVTEVIMTGENLAIDATVPRTIWPLGATNKVHRTSDAIIQISSTSPNDTLAGTGMQVGLVLGVDGANNAISESVDMAGQSGVSLSAQFKDVNAVVPTQVGSTTWNEGQIFISLASATLTGGEAPAADSYFVKEIKHSQSGTTASRTVENGFQYLFKDITISPNSNKVVTASLRVISSDGIESKIFPFTVSQLFTPSIRLFPAFPAGTYIESQAAGEGAGAEFRISITFERRAV